MSIPIRTVTRLKAAITGNVVAQEFVNSKSGRRFGSEGIEAGGQVVLGTATTVNISVTDAQGKVLYSASGVVANTTIAPLAVGVKGPLVVTTTNISNMAHTLTIYWDVKK